jgi:hypothetical protein
MKPKSFGRTISQARSLSFEPPQHPHSCQQPGHSTLQWRAIPKRQLTDAEFEGTVKHDFGELDEVGPAYAVTIHKSQGSEFPAVVIPLATQHYMLLQRELDLHRHHEGQEAGRPNRAEEGVGYRCS